MVYQVNIGRGRIKVAHFLDDNGQDQGRLPRKKHPFFWTQITPCLEPCTYHDCDGDDVDGNLDRKSRGNICWGEGSGGLCQANTGWWGLCTSQKIQKRKCKVTHERKATHKQKQIGKVSTKKGVSRKSKNGREKAEHYKLYIKADTIHTCENIISIKELLWGQFWV